MTGSSEQFEARGAIKTAIWSRTYTNTGGDAGMTGSQGNNENESQRLQRAGRGKSGSDRTLERGKKEDMTDEREES